MFYELDTPHRALLSPKFYVSTVDAVAGSVWFLRNDGKGLDNGSGDFDLYLFDTELEAHENALIYYHDHGMAYTHIDDLLALNKNPIGNNTEDSQIMEFI